MTELSFGEWLKRRRGAQGWTQQQLAQKLNCSFSTLRKLEAEERHPSTQIVEQLIEVFQISQNEQKAFQRFARGDWGAFSSEESASSPWYTPRVAQRTNLPASITSFIGREKEQEQVIKLISKYRLVTLTGTGGVGKTRLSLKVGEQILGDYTNGVWLVELAPLSDPELLPHTLAALFGIAAQSHLPLVELLINFLRAKTLLIILDNCEHLLEACAQLSATLLKHCPDLKILATSREALGVQGEAMYGVPPLGLPDVQLMLDTFSDYESVRLFEERAQLTQSDFSLTLENVSSVAQICRRLDGIPLAIELAAAHVNMFSTEQIAVRLTDSFNLLTEGSRTALPRQQTIRASIDWSWNLLTDSEHILLRRLSIFAGGWTLETAESVCGGNSIESSQVLGLMTQLVKKSLVMVNQAAGRETRHHFHAMVRQYTYEKLVEVGEMKTIRGQHLKYFLKLSEQIEPGLHSPQQMEWLVRAKDELDNIRAALEWAGKANVEAGLYLSGRLHRFWQSSDMREGMRWLDEFIQKPESQQFPHARAKALLTLGWELFWSDKFDPARTCAEECLELYKLWNDQYGEVDALTLLGAISHVQGKVDLELLYQALSIAQLLKDSGREAYVWSRLGSAGGNYQSRIDNLEKAVRLFRELGDLRSLAGHLGALGNYELLSGNFDSAQKFLDEAYQLNRQLNDRAGNSGNLLIALSRIESKKGNFEGGHTFLEEGIAIVEELGLRMTYLWSRAHLGYLTLAEGKSTQAHNILTKTTQEFYKDKSEIGVAFTLEGMAGYYIAVDQPKQAASLIGWADTTREKVNDPRPPLEQADVDKIIAACLEKIGEFAFADAYNEGQKMTLDEVVAYALSNS